MITPGISVWVVDDDESVRWVLEQALKQAHMIPRSFDSASKFFAALDDARPDVLVTDIRMPEMSGLELLEKLGAREPDLPVIVMTAHSDLDSAVAAYKGGAFEYLPKPFDIDEASSSSPEQYKPALRLGKPIGRRSLRRSSARHQRCRRCSAQSEGCRARA